MSWRHIEATAKLELRSSLKLVLVIIAHHTNDHSGIAWPGLQRLERFTGMDRRSIRRCINELETSGLLRVKRGTGKTSSVYTLTLPGEPEIDITDDKTLPPEALGPGGTQSPPSPRGDRGSSQGGRRVPSEGTQSPPNTIERERTDASDARAFDEDWKPKAGTIAKIKLEENLDEDDIEHQLRLFVLKNLETETQLINPDAAFRRWCARVKDLNHPPKKAAARKKDDGPLTIEQQIANIEGLIPLYRKMGRETEIPALEAKLKLLKSSPAAAA